MPPGRTSRLSNPVTRISDRARRRRGMLRVRGLAGGAAVAGVLALGLAGVAVAGSVPGAGAATGVAARAAGGPAGARAGSAGAAAGTRPRSAPAGSGSGVLTPTLTWAGNSATSSASRTRRPVARAARPVARAGLHTSCRSIAHIGDSTSLDLVSPDYLPDPAQRLAAQYADVGVRHLRVDASGGRSIVEELPGQRNGYVVARAWRDEGFRGCWVFALGTNDTANVAVGSAVGLMARIQRMMSVAHGEPVLWVNTRTELSGGPWAEANEAGWDATLVRALARYPNMRIFNWAAVAQPGWFLSDGIHYTSAGCAVRARAIADALARAFPESGHGHGRVVS
jgi:hypothetical protein